VPSYNSLKATPQHGSRLLKMIELKIGPGVTPGHGGVLPAATKISEEISRVRGVPIRQAYFSPSSHSRFSTAIGMMQFIGAPRGLSGSKPAGFPREPVRDAIAKDFEDARLPWGAYGLSSRVSRTGRRNLVAVAQGTCARRDAKQIQSMDTQSVLRSAPSKFGATYLTSATTA
jgi:hypothetical protein